MPTGWGKGVGEGASVSVDGSGAARRGFARGSTRRRGGSEGADRREGRWAEATGWGSRTGGALQEGVSVVRERLHHLLHHRQLAVVRLVGEVDVVRHPSHGEWVGGHGCRVLGRRVSVPGRPEAIDRAFDQAHRLARRIDARARWVRPIHRSRRDARADMLGSRGTEASTYAERGGFRSRRSTRRQTSPALVRSSPSVVKFRRSNHDARAPWRVDGRPPIARLASAGTTAPRTTRCSSAVASSAGAT